MGTINGLLGACKRRMAAIRADSVMTCGGAAVAGIIPRWEWRVFGTGFVVAEDAFAGLVPGRVEESDELYLLSAAGANIKVRYDLMDIKLLREVDGDGLERWEPVMKAGFPLQATEVPRMFDALGVLAPPLTRDAYSLEQFLAELVEPSDAVRVVRVHKRRQRYTLANCMAEVADVEVDGRVARTIAVESEDPSAVMAAVRRLGLDGEVNTSYPAGLWARMDDGLQRYAVIDVGTNSVKFHIAERDPGGGWRTIVDRAELTRLGESLGDQGVIAAEPLERTVAAIADMVEEATRQRVRATAAVGTAGLRIARNRDQVIAAIRTRTGVTVEVISGEEESRLAYLAARAGLGATEGSLVVFGAIHRAIRARRRGGTRGVGRCPGSGRRRSGPHRWPPAARCPGGHGRRGDQHDSRDAGDGHLRSGSGPGGGAGPGRARPADRAVPLL